MRSEPAVRDAGQVHGGQRGQHADGHPLQGVAVERPFGRHRLRQAAALDVLAHDVRLLVVHPGVQRPGDVHARNALDTLEPLSVLRPRAGNGREQLDHSGGSVLGLLAEVRDSSRPLVQPSEEGVSS